MAGELFPRDPLTKNISIGIYYLYSHGLDAGTIGNTNFVTLGANFSNIKLSRQFFLKLLQFYYLKLDEKDGFYFTSTITLSKKNFPLSISAIVNKVIETDIAGKDLVWNLSLLTPFTKNMLKASRAGQVGLLAGTPTAAKLKTRNQKLKTAYGQD